MGGWFLPRVPQREGGWDFRILRAAMRKFGWKSRFVAQWDSWRFWETMAAGAAAVQLDLEYYGAVLPVMPVANEHYVALRLDDKGIETALSILASSEKLRTIGESGRRWALEHYSPAATAQRILTISAGLTDTKWDDRRRAGTHGLWQAS